MTTSDNMENVWNRFFQDRTDPLVDRFPGWYRAIVAETNDPLGMRRVRFRCPELHNANLKPENCPWAYPAPRKGGKRSGDFDHPIIGDIIYITFEKQHPYGPIYVSTGDGTRRKRYPLESIYIESPLSVDEDGNPADIPDDFIEDYLPKDRRPMSHGWSDRYGHAEINSAVGYFPDEHKKRPAPLGEDAVSQRNFDVELAEPEVNNPDMKFIARLTKGGGYELISDVGYFWQKENGSEFGEFTGRSDDDEDFEIKRAKYFTRLLSENRVQESDQRRMEWRTRYGHKLEMRDVGWAQEGGGRSGSEDAGKTKTRQDEYDEPRIISKNKDTDERWVKWRTKGGHIIQLMDAGFHPEEDEFVKRRLIEEIGAEGDGEKEAKWTERDARQMRLVSRHGFKIVIDDRGSDPKDSEGKEDPHGNGMLIKGRRSWDGETERGFGWEYNEKDQLNATRWYTPKSKVIEMNDNRDYIMVCTDTKREISREWKKLTENEFALRMAMVEAPEADTYHLKLDKFNGYIRLKTAAGGDNGRRPFGGAEGQGFFIMENADEGIGQGIEMRDGRAGRDGPWAELVDLEHRGIWLTKNEQMGIWRSREGKDQFIMINDGNNSIVIRNNENGPVQIFSQKRVEIIGDDIAFNATRKISFRAGNEIAMEAGNAHTSLRPGSFGSDVRHVAPRFVPGSQDATMIVPTQIGQTKREPADRGATDNGPYNEVDEKVVTNE